MKKRLLFAVAALALVASMVGLAQTTKQRVTSSTTTPSGPMVQQAELKKADLLKEAIRQGQIDPIKKRIVLPAPPSR